VEIILHADIKTPVQVDIAVPRIKLPNGTRWHEEPTMIEIALPVLPEQAARFLSKTGFKRSETSSYLWEFEHENSAVQLTATVVASSEEWDDFEKSLSKTPRGKTPKPILTMHLDWPFNHPAFQSMKAGEFQMGDAVLRVLPENDQLIISVPVDRNMIEEIKDIGYAIHPLDDWQEEVWWDQLTIARLLKPEVLIAETKFVSPYLTLHGMQNSLAHPIFMRPFLPALPQVDHGEMSRIIRETINNSAELELAWDSEEAEGMEAAFQQEYLGFDHDDLDLLLRVPVSLTENLALENFGDDIDEDQDEWLSQVFSLLVISSICGSRVARAELARRGYDTSLDKRLGERDCMDLATGVLHFADALYDAIGDTRAAHLWSLERRAAMQAEIILDEMIMDNMPDGIDEDICICDVFLSFDLGVRYQMARVAPELLQEYDIEKPHGGEANDDPGDASNGIPTAE